MVADPPRLHPTTSMPRTARSAAAARAVTSARSPAVAKSPTKLPKSAPKSNGKRPAKAPPAKVATAKPAPAKAVVPAARPSAPAKATPKMPPAPSAPLRPASVASASPSTLPPAPALTPPPPPAHMTLQRPSHRPGPPPGIAIPPLPLVPAPDFKVGDKAVHPSHGVGEVQAIEKREIGGSSQNFYILRILDNGMKVMVPVSAATQVGLRAIMSDKEANNILTTMRAREVAVDVQPWSRRFRVYTEMIKSGSPVEIAKVLRDMNRLKFDKDLSFGERRLLDQARSLLLKELAFAKKKTEAEMAEEIKKIFTT
jgi:CarD family transcriptional regulator